MVQHIRNAFMDNLQDVKWMDSKTKQAAMEKVTGMISDNFNVSASLRALSPCHLEESQEVRREPNAKGDESVRAWSEERNIRRSVSRSLAARFARHNWRACSQATHSKA